MPTTYRDAPTAVYSLMKSVMRDHFPDLAGLDPELSIEILMATNHTGPAVKFGGVGATAKLKQVGPEERANDGPGLRLLVDSSRWEALSDRQKEALFHHELSHIEPKRDRESGQLVIDEYNLLACKLRPDDWLLSGFEETVRVFGTDALEHRAIMAVHETLRQMSLSFMEAAGEAVAAMDGVESVTISGPGIPTTEIPGKGKRKGRKAKPAPALQARRKPAILPEGLQ